MTRTKNEVILYRGISGSGKSTLAQAHPYAYVVSADNFFMVNDQYKFEAYKLPQAHSECLRLFVEAIHEDQGQIVVDNTNTTIQEIAPYAALALAYGYRLSVVTLLCNPAEGWKRNAHNVNADVIVEQDRKLRSTQIPRWCNHDVIFPGSFQERLLKIQKTSRIWGL